MKSITWGSVKTAWDMFWLPLSLLLAVTLALSVGCNQPIEKNARDAIAVSKGYLASAITKHGAECTVSHGNAEYCQTIIKAAQAQNALVSALEAYCQIPPHGTDNNPNLACNPIQTKADALKTALADAVALTNDIQKAAQ